MHKMPGACGPQKKFKKKTRMNGRRCKYVDGLKQPQGQIRDPKAGGKHANAQPCPGKMEQSTTASLFKGGEELSNYLHLIRARQRKRENNNNAVFVFSFTLSKGGLNIWHSG